MDETIHGCGGTMANRSGLSDSELEVLRALWDHGPGNVRRINEVLSERGRTWAYTTVATLLQRLGSKGYAQSDPTEIPHVYRALVSREDLLDERLREAAEELCGGHAAPLVLALVQSHRFSPEELERFRRLIDERTSRGSGGTPRSGGKS